MRTTIKSEENPDDNINKMKARVIAEATVSGLLLGATVGAVGGGEDNRVKGGIMGGLAGATGGAAAGYYVANKKEDYGSFEQYLDACIKEASLYNETAKRQNLKLAEVIKDTEKEINIIKNQVKDKEAKKKKAQIDKNSLDQIALDTDEAINTLQELIIANNKAIEDVSENFPQKKQLQKEIEITKKQIDDLKRARGKMGNLIDELADLTV